jgi:hypothetical protein
MLPVGQTGGQLLGPRLRPGGHRLMNVGRRHGRTAAASNEQAGSSSSQD